MIEPKSEKNHWENVMKFENNVIDNYMKSFLETEQFKLLNVYVPNWEEKKTFFEIGAAPWLYWMIFKKYFDYVVWWIEYTDSWYNSIKKFFQNRGEDYRWFIKWDFFKFDGGKFDIVFSWWFIEHFDNYIDVIERHIKITKKWGKIIIIVPKYHFYYKFFQPFLYPWLMEKQHNVKIMDIDEFTRIFKKLEKIGEIKIEFIWWIEQANFWQLVSKNKFVQKLVYWLHLFLKKTWLYRFLPKDYSWIMVIAEHI